MEGSAVGRAAYEWRDVLTIYKGKDHGMDHEAEWEYAGIQLGKIAWEREDLFHRAQEDNVQDRHQ